jgi:ADP-ribosylglycohydrolase
VKPDTVTLDRFRGCLLGAAVGDALGAPVEFMSRAAIEKEYGPDGIGTYLGPVGHVTDDTQMLLYTAAACLSWQDRPSAVCSMEMLIEICWSAYQEWGRAQFGRVAGNPVRFPRVTAAVERQGPRAPGVTCTGSLSGNPPGSPLEPLNNSKGAGGIMRTAPLGLLGPRPDPFIAGCLAAALTHGHPLGYYPAGVLALMVHNLTTRKNTITGTLDVAIQRLHRSAVPAAGSDLPHLGQLVQLLQEAELLDTTDHLSGWRPGVIGQGWVAEEALAIGVAALLATEHRSTPFEALRWSVNHGGDSDTTGCVAGALLGACYGTEWIPEDLAMDVEDHDLIVGIADALYEAATGRDVRRF